MTFIQTYPSRKKFDLANPRAADVSIEDIAWHLSQQNRYAGGTPLPYSVAQHSCLVSDQLPQPLQLEGLLHDAHEAYLVDVPTPVKQVLGDAWRELEATIQACVLRAFGIYRPPPPEVVAADDLLRSTEAKCLLKSGDDWEWPGGERPRPIYAHMECWHFTHARMAFLRRFDELAPAYRNESRCGLAGADAELDYYH